MGHEASGGLACPRLHLSGVGHRQGQRSQKEVQAAHPQAAISQVGSLSVLGALNRQLSASTQLERFALRRPLLDSRIAEGVGYARIKVRKDESNAFGVSAVPEREFTSVAFVYGIASHVKGSQEGACKPHGATGAVDGGPRPFWRRESDRQQGATRPCGCF